MNDQAPGTVSERHSRPGLVWIGIVVGLVFPTIVTLAYFVLAEGSGSGTQQSVYGVMKVLQFVFPAAWVWLVLGEAIRLSRPKPEGVGLGVAFGLLVVIAGLLVYWLVLRQTQLFATAAPEIRAKVVGFGLAGVGAYAALGLFYSLFHSLLEEYYWRWFVFGQLRRVIPLRAAIVASAAGFTAHHVLLLHRFFGDSLLATSLLSAAIFVGGVFWAWLYQRSKSLYGPWASHLLIDAGIFLVGFDLIHGG